MRQGRRRWLCATAATAALPLFSQSAHVATTQLPPRPQPVPLDYFGLHIHDPATPWPAYRFGRLRLWDTRTSWFHLQPERDRWEFARLDGFVLQAQQRGVGIVLPLGMTPTWAATRPFEKSPYNVPGASSEPAEIGDWKNYVRTVAQRYKGRVRHYEIWNEVNAGAGFFTGTPEAMFELQRFAYEVLKAVDPGITVISPSTEGSTEDKFRFFERYMALMAGRYADAVAYHFYTPRQAPEAMLPVVQRVQTILDRTGNGGLPLWNTESGYRIDWGQNKPLSGTWATWPNLQPAIAAAWLVRSYLLAWGAGIDSHFWYAYDSKVMGMVPASREASVVSDAYGLVARRLTGCVLDPVTIEAGVAWLRARKAGVDCWWAWTTQDAAQSWRLAQSMSASFVSTLDGQIAPISDGRVQLGPMPVMLAQRNVHFGS